MNSFKIILCAGLLTFLSYTQSFAATGEVHAQCHDGTKLSLSLNTQSCLSKIGTNYLIQKIFNFCSQHCSTLSGKCAVSKMNGTYGDCTEDGPEVMYQGFSAICHDGSTFDFNSCSPETDFVTVAERQCQGLQNSTTGEVGVKTLTLKERCN